MKLYIGENIRRLRIERGLTQESLAEKLGVSFQSVSRWETEQSYPDIELVPEIASFFEVTSDELMGTDKAKMEKRLIDDWYSATCLDTEEEQLEKYREMRRIYPKNSLVLHSLIYTLSNFPEYLDEQRELTEEYLCMPDVNGTSRDVIISALVAAEDESRLTALLDKYATRYDQMSRPALLAARYQKRGDEENSKRYSQLAFLDKLTGIEQGLIKYSSRDKCGDLRRPLEFINMLTGLSGKSLVAGDGEPDLWFNKRLMYGLNLAGNCSKNGDIEEAFLHLEDTVTLLERFYSLPGGTTLTFRCPVLSELKITLVESKCSMAFVKASASPEKLKYYKCLRATAPDFGLDMKKNESDRAVEREMDQYHLYCPEYDIYPLIAKEGWEKFDPIRNDPRYAAYVDRIRRFIIEV